MEDDVKNNFNSISQLAEFMEIADSDRDGVLTFEEFMHAHEELQKRVSDKYGNNNNQNTGGSQEVDDLPPDY